MAFAPEEFVVVNVLAATKEKNEVKVRS